MGETGLPPAKVEQLAADLVKAGRAIRFQDVLLSPVVVALLRDRATTIVDQFHKANPLVAGIGREQLRETLALT